MTSDVDKLLHRIAVLEEAVTAAAITMVMDLGRENVVTADDRSAVRLLCAAIGWDPVRNPERAESFVDALRASGPVPKDPDTTAETMAMKIARLSKACDEALAAYNAAAKRALDAEDAKKAFGFVAEEMVIAAVIETVGPDPELKELRGELIDAVALAVERATNPKSSN